MTDSALTKQRTDGHVWQAGGPEVHQDSGGAATTRARGVSSPGCIRRSTTMPDISGCQEEVADGEDKDSRLDMDVAARRGSSNVAKFEVTDEDGNDQLLGEQDTTKPETVARVQETDLDEAPNPHITHVEGGAEKKCVLDSETVREDMQCSRTSNGNFSSHLFWQIGLNCSPISHHQVGAPYGLLGQNHRVLPLYHLGLRQDHLARPLHHHIHQRKPMFLPHAKKAMQNRLHPCCGRDCRKTAQMTRNDYHCPGQLSARPPVLQMFCAKLPAL